MTSPLSLPAFHGFSHSAPVTVLAIFAQIGGFSLRGALVRCGSPRGSLEYRLPAHRATDVEVRGSFRSHWDQASNDVAFEVGLAFPVNGARGEDWRVIVAYEGDDTYTVWLTGMEDGARFQIACARDTYCENLQEVVESAYDEAIELRAGGFIPLD